MPIDRDRYCKQHGGRALEQDCVACSANESVGHPTWPPAKEQDPDKCPACGHADGRASSCRHGWHKRGPDSRRLTWADIDAAAAAKQAIDPDPPVADSRPWCVFVSGSRDLEWDKHRSLVEEALRPFRHEWSALIHGHGTGCDAIADRVGDILRFRVYRFPARWDLHRNPDQRNRAGPIRNRLCARVWVAFHEAGYRLAMLGFSTGGPGTEGAIKLAKNLSAGIPEVLIEKISITL